MTDRHVPGPGWSADRIEQALSPALRAQFSLEHRAFLAVWQARAEQDAPAPAPRPAVAPQKWGDLMDDWEL